MSDRNAAPQQKPQDSTTDILYLVDRLEELVGMGKRVPFSGRVMVEEEEFLALVDQLRVAVPSEIRQAQRVIRDREHIIGQAQDEANRIVHVGQEHAEKLVSEHGILAEARQRGEDILRQAEEERQRARGEIDVFILEQLQLVDDAVRRGMAIMEDAAEQTLETTGSAKDAIGR